MGAQMHNVGFRNRTWAGGLWRGRGACGCRGATVTRGVVMEVLRMIDGEFPAMAGLLRDGMAVSVSWNSFTQDANRVRVAASEHAKRGRAEGVIERVPGRELPDSWVLMSNQRCRALPPCFSVGGHDARPG